MVRGNGINAPPLHWPNPARTASPCRNRCVFCLALAHRCIRGVSPLTFRFGVRYRQAREAQDCGRYTRLSAEAALPRRLLV